MRHASRQRTHHVARSVALTMTAVIAFGATAAGAVAWRLQGNVDHIDIDDLVVAANPTVTREPDPDDPNAGSPVNILLVGTDIRTGANAIIGGEDSSVASDTTIVMHISADRSRVELVSIPRDSMVALPSCTGSNGSTSKPRSYAQFNEAFGIGWTLGGDTASATACTVSAVQSLTGVTINHVAVVDMAGFQQMIDAIGGVDICVPTAMKDKYTGLDITAGYQHFDGATALRFARARHVQGTDGSDLTRIGSQQRLLSAVLTEVLSKNVVTDVPQLLSFLSAATSSLTTDNDLSLKAMAGIAFSAKNLKAGDVTFLTIPVAADPKNKNRVVWTSAADTVWANMVQDLPVVTPEVPTTPTGTAPPTPTDGTTTTPPGTEPVAPAPVETKVAGREAFTGADVTAVCS